MSSGSSDELTIRLKCVKEGGRIRVRVISPGYNPNANCQCPRDIRVDGKEFEVPVSALSFSDTRGKFFYRIKGKFIKEVSGGSVTVDKVFESAECVVCLECSPTIIFAPCGHFCSCDECAKSIFNTTKKCPMCRATINQLVTKDQLQ